MKIWENNVGIGDLGFDVTAAEAFVIVVAPLQVDFGRHFIEPLRPLLDADLDVFDAADAAAADVVARHGRFQRTEILLLNWKQNPIN